MSDERLSDERMRDEQVSDERMSDERISKFPALGKCLEDAGGVLSVLLLIYILWLCQFTIPEK